MITNSICLDPLRAGVSGKQQQSSRNLAIELILQFAGYHHSIPQESAADSDVRYVQILLGE